VGLLLFSEMFFVRSTIYAKIDTGVVLIPIWRCFYVPYYTHYRIEQ